MNHTGQQPGSQPWQTSHQLSQSLHPAESQDAAESFSTTGEPSLSVSGFLNNTNESSIPGTGSSSSAVASSMNSSMSADTAMTSVAYGDEEGELDVAIAASLVDPQHANEQTAPSHQTSLPASNSTQSTQISVFSLLQTTIPGASSNTHPDTTTTEHSLSLS